MTPDQGRPPAQAPLLAGLDDAAWPVYTTGQVAHLLGVQPAFLRRLDTEQVVRPARSAGGQRRYSRTEISRIQQVARLAGEGFSLPAIREVLALQSEVTELRRQLAAEQARHSP
jgi:MerR family transcriptional regulator/heat shock protein HspR